MTEAQKNEMINQIVAFDRYERRAFRKKCVTQGIVTFRREEGSSYYTMRYRDQLVTLLWGNDDEELRLLAVWYTIHIAEKTIKKIEGVKHDCK